MSRFERNVMLSRVRLLALRAMVQAGGNPGASSLLRAVEPVLGDLLPLPSQACSERSARELAAAAGVQWQKLDRAISADVTASGRGRGVLASRASGLL